MQFLTHMKWLVAAIIIVCQCGVCASLATAEDDREFRERMQDLSRRYMELRREGPSPEAEEIRQHMIDLARERSESQRRHIVVRREINERIADLQRELTELREAGEGIRAEEIEKLIEQHREELSSLNRSETPPSKERSLEERIQHIHEAAEHLELAGMSHFSRMLQEEANILANNHRELQHIHERERAMRAEAEQQKHMAEEHRLRAEQELQNAQRQVEELTRQLNDSRRRSPDERRGEPPSRSERSSREFGQAWNDALRELAPQESQQRPDSERLRRLYEERTRIERERSEQIRRQSSDAPFQTEDVERSRNEPPSSSRDADRESNRDRESQNELRELQSLVNSLRGELFRLKVKVQTLERRHPEIKASPRPSRPEVLEPTPVPEPNGESTPDEKPEDADGESTGNVIPRGDEQEVSVFAGSNSYQLPIPNQGIRFAQSPEAETSVW